MPNNHYHLYVYKWGVNFCRNSMLEPNFPASSDHLGISFNINIAELFEGKYGILATPTHRKLTTKNIKAKLSYIANQWSIHKLYGKAAELYDIAKAGLLSSTHVLQFYELDKTITQILLNGEETCTKHHK
jgi:hypothetical protein